MIYGSVCSGIEAASVAWQPLGWKPAFFSEIAQFPQAVLRHHHGSNTLAMSLKRKSQLRAEGGIWNFGDFTSIRPRTLRRLGIDPAIDVLVGGTPCQDFSIAGKRAGLDGGRGNLTLEYARLARRLGSRWLVWENVPGVFSNNKGRDFGAVLACFAGGAPGDEFAVPKDGWQNAGVAPSLSSDGYGIAWRVFDAQYAGVPQRRRRVFVVGYLGDWRPAAAVLLEREGLRGDSAPSRGARPDVTGTIGGVSPGGSWRLGADEAAAGQLVSGTLQANGKAAGSATSQDAESGLLVAAPLRAQAQPSLREDSDTYIPVAFGGNNCSGPIDVATACTASHTASGRQDFESETFVVAQTLRARDLSKGVDSDCTDTLIPFDTTQITAPTNRSNPKSGDPCHPLAAQSHPPAIAFSCKDHGADATHDISPTLCAMGHRDSHPNAGGQIAVAIPILEAGARTGISTIAPRAGMGIGDAGDPMFTPQAGKQHAVCVHGTQDPDMSVEQAHALVRNQGQENAVCITGDVTHTIKAEGFDASEDGTGRGQPIVASIALRGREGGATAEMGTDIAGALRASQGGGDKPHVLERSAVRRLLPIECERLQGFPDNHTRIPMRHYTKRKITGMRPADMWEPDPAGGWWLMAADGPRYMSLGNSMAVPEMSFIGQQIDKVEKLLSELREAAE